MISVINITKKFDEFTAVDNLSMEVKKGEVLGFTKTGKKLKIGKFK